MATDDSEDRQLRAVSLQTANAIFLARQRAERDLLSAKEALRKSEEQLRAITDATPALIAYLDTDCRYRFANLQCARWFDRPQEQIIGLHMREVLGEEAFARLHPHVARALSGEDVEFESEVPYRDAGTRFVTASYHPDRAGDGSVRGIYVLVIDITDRKRAEDALRQTENRLLMAMEAGQMGAWEWVVATGKVTWSPTLEVLHGLAPGSFGGSFEDVQREMHPDDRARVLATISECLESRSEYRIEYRIVRPDGAVLWIEARGKLLLDAQGNPERMAGLCMDITARKHAEDALRQSEQFNRTIIESSHDCIKTLTLDGVLLWINRVGLDKVSATDPAQVVGKSWLDFWEGESRKLAEDAVRAAVAGGTGIFLGSFTIAGRTTWWDVAVTPIVDADGKPERLLVVSRDATERRKLEETHARLAAVVEFSDDAIVSKTLESIVTTWNKGAERMFGYTAAEMIGKPVTILIPPDCMDEEPEILARVSRGEVVAPYESVRRRKDGTLLDVSLTVSPIKDASGKIIGASKIARDITQRRKGEEERERLLASEQLARAQAEEAENRASFLAEASASLASTLDYEVTLGNVAQAAVPGIADWCAVHLREPDGGIRVVATAHFDPAKLAIARELQERYPEDPDSPFGMPAVLRSGQSVLYPEIADDLLVATCRDAEHLALVRGLGLKSAIVVPLIANGQTLGAITLVAAESGRHFSEADLPFAEDLAARAAAAAENARLYREVRHANAAKDHFMAVLSHELRTPLNPVLMTVTDLERDDTVPAHVREQMTVVRRNVELEARLIDDLLDSTRIANGKLQLQRTVVDARELLRRAIAIVEGDARTQGVSLSVSTCEAPAPVDGDPARLQQVFWNVVKNAVKFTPSGGSVRVACEITDRGTIRVSVTDTGVGIAPEDAAKIFNAFEQGDTGIAHRFGGLGLGLAISKALVTMHDGTLTAHSEGRDRGATFTVELPLTREARTHTTEAPAPHVEHRALRLLIAEDHEATSAIMGRLLKRRGYSVTLASTVKLALEILEHTPIDLLVSDLGLPDGTGGELMEKIREKRNLPGIALSGYGTDSDVGRSRAAGFSLHLTKPVDIERLDLAIQSLATKLGL